MNDDYKYTDKDTDKDNDLDHLYQSRKKQFTAPDASKFKANNETPFWKNWAFYSSVSAFSLALVVFIPMMNNQASSDLIIMEQAFDPQESLDNLSDMGQFSAQPATNPPTPAPAKKASMAKQMMQIQTNQLSERKKIDPCKEKRELMAKHEAMQNDNPSKGLANNELLELDDCIE